MKLNENFIRHQVDGETLIVPTGSADFHGLIQGNKTLSAITECLTQDTTEEQISKLFTDEGGVLIRAGATSDSFTFNNDITMYGHSDFTLEFDKDVTINIAAQFDIECDGGLSGWLTNYIYNSGVLNVSGELNVGPHGAFSNMNKMTIESSGSMVTGDQSYSENYHTLVNKGTVTVEAGGEFDNMFTEDPDASKSSVFDNYGTVTINSGGNFSNLKIEGLSVSVFNNRGGAMVTVETGGTFANESTFNNYSSANAVINGVIENVSEQTFNNYGTVILSDTGVLNNGDGAGNDGVFNNFADDGVILNSGTIINNDGSTFRNYGTIIEETPDAVSPDLAPGSRPVVRYGEDPDAVLSGIPEGAVGGPCGDALFWYLEELEEEEAEKLRHFTEGHTASASDAERAEDNASVSYVLHITGSGAMDDFTLEGGKSSAPWFEELDGAVRAVKIDEGVTKIGKNAFYGIRTLAYISFAGTEAEWQTITARSGNEALDKAVFLFGGDDDLVLGDPLIAEDEEVTWTEPEAKPAADAADKPDAAADKPAADMATASDAEKEETKENQKEEQKEQGGPEQEVPEQEVPEQEVPKQEDPKQEDPEAPRNGKQEDEA